MAKDRKVVTKQQAEAYRLVYIHDCKYSEAALLMGCSQQNVSQLLRRLKKKKPALFFSKRRPQTRTFIEAIDSTPARKL